VHKHDHDHSGHAGHGHDHGHEQAHEVSTRALKAALTLTLVVLVAEAIGGWISNSLALLADAGHVLTDAGALALSLFVAWFSRQPGNPEKTYGYLRWEILAALINGATLLGLSVWIAVEAVMRLQHPEPVGGTLMLIVAVAGLAANGLAAWWLHPVEKGSMNVRGAYLHIIGDLLASVGVIAAALIIRFTGWLAADPIASLVATALIVRGSWRLVREAVDVLLESTPSHIALGDVRAKLEGIAGVQSVHDLHVWSVSSGMVALSAHAIVPDNSNSQTVLEKACALLGTMGIHHVTIQIEQRDICVDDAHVHP
jgi:cobalt-zinc-cadmium efflux system protein